MTFSSRGLPDPGTEAMSPVSPVAPALAGRFSTTEPPGNVPAGAGGGKITPSENR